MRRTAIRAGRKAMAKKTHHDDLYEIYPEGRQCPNGHGQMQIWRLGSAILGHVVSICMECGQWM